MDIRLQPVAQTQHIHTSYFNILSIYLFRPAIAKVTVEAVSL